MAVIPGTDFLPVQHTEAVPIETPTIEYRYRVDRDDDGAFAEDITRYVQHAKIHRGVTFNTGTYPLCKASVLTLQLSDYNKIYYPFDVEGVKLPVSLKIMVDMSLGDEDFTPIFVGWLDRTDYKIRNKKDSLFTLKALGIISVLNAIPYSAGFDGEKIRAIEYHTTKQVCHEILSTVKLPINIVKGEQNTDHPDNDIKYLPADLVAFDTREPLPGGTPLTEPIIVSSFVKLGVWKSINQTVLQAIRNLEIAEVGLLREKNNGTLVFESNRYRNKAHMPRWIMSTDIHNPEAIPIIDVQFPQNYDSVSKKVKISLSNIEKLYNQLIAERSEPVRRGQPGTLLDVDESQGGYSVNSSEFELKFQTQFGVERWTGAKIGYHTVWDPDDPKLDQEYTDDRDDPDYIPPYLRPKAWEAKHPFTGARSVGDSKSKRFLSAYTPNRGVGYEILHSTKNSVIIRVVNGLTAPDQDPDRGNWIQIDSIELYGDFFVKSETINAFEPPYGSISWRDEKPLEVVAEFLAKDYSIKTFASKIFDRFSTPLYRPMITIDAQYNSKSAEFAANAEISDLVGLVVDLPEFQHGEKYYIENIQHDLKLSGRHLMKVQLSRAIV